MKTKEEKDVSKWRTGVSIPSQRRFIEYFARVLANEVELETHEIKINKVTVRLRENFGMIAKSM